MVDPEGDHGDGDARRPALNLLVIGAARSGTTALVRSLERHPEVQFTQPKETHFFAHPNETLAYTGPGDAETVNARSITDADHIAAQFAGSAATARGEGSVSTLCLPDSAIPAIEAFADREVKLVAILREPADRAYSSYLYLRGRGFEDLVTFEAGLAAEDERHAAGHQHMWRYRGLSRYEEQLPAFIERFSERLYVMVFEEFRADPKGELDRLCVFLGLPLGHDLVLGNEVNRGGEASSRLLVRITSFVRRIPLARRLTLALTSTQVRDRVRGSKLERPDAAEATMQQLRDEFAPTRAFVEAHLGRPIPSWDQR